MNMTSAYIIVGLVSALAQPLVNMVPAWYQKYNEWKSSSSYKLKLDNELYGRLKKALIGVKGQNAAIETIVDSVCGWSESKSNNLDSSKGGLVIHMAGVSGTGKSMTANILTDELSKKSAIKISYSSIDSKDPRSCAEQLFGSYVRKSSSNTDVKCNTKYAAQLMYNPEVVVQIDEFDKFMMRDDSLQMLLWDVSDTGRLKIDKDTYIDCSKTIFILTSNASRESIKMKLDKAKNDDSDSLESVKFKQAFLNRITSVYFENFSEKIYKEILLLKLEPIKAYYSEKYNVSLNFSDNTLNKLAKELSNMKTGGARNVGIFVRKMYAAINYFKRENHISESNNKEKYDVNVCYDNDRFNMIKM